MKSCVVWLRSTFLKTMCLILRCSNDLIKRTVSTTPSGPLDIFSYLVEVRGIDLFRPHNKSEIKNLTIFTNTYTHTPSGLMVTVPALISCMKAVHVPNSCGIFSLHKRERLQSNFLPHRKLDFRLI